MLRSARLTFTLLLAVVSLLSLSIAGTLAVVHQQGWLQPSSPHPTLDKVRARGYLKCGVDGNLPSFSTQQLDEPSNNISVEDKAAGFYANASGFDADFCRVVAVAIFGKYQGRIAFLNVDINLRFTTLRDDVIDLLVRDTTWTAGGDVRLGIDFGPVIFHDGQKFIVHDDPTVDEESMTIDALVAYLANKRICVAEKATSLSNLRRIFTERNTAFKEIIAQNNRETAAAYLLGECDALTADESQLLGRLAILPDRQQHKMIPAQAISYEPLAPVVAEGDPHWRDLVSYAVWTTIRAEELGLSQANLGKYNNIL